MEKKKKKEYEFTLYYLAKFEGEKIKEITDGPFFSESAAKKHSSKYGWAAEDYTVIQTKQTFTKTKG